LLSIINGLGAALGWGATDFTGRLISRRTGAYRAVLCGETVGSVFIIVAIIFLTI
jgi:hypothetical protein